MRFIAVMLESGARAVTEYTVPCTLHAGVAPPPTRRSGLVPAAERQSLDDSHALDWRVVDQWAAAHAGALTEWHVRNYRSILRSAARRCPDAPPVPASMKGENQPRQPGFWVVDPWLVGELPTEVVTKGDAGRL